ncbi:MAG: hypothetical protein IJY69_01130 [Clostridia bacterium]|nr:hypothetical protein [Clostridia bacterium]
MGTNFRKFKAGIGAVTVMLSCLLGLSVGGLSASLLWLLSKLELIAVIPLYYILCAFVGVLVGAVAFVTHIPTDRRVAKKIDVDLTFGERAQTMIEFRDEDSAMHQLQRIDTETLLGKSSPRKLRFRRLWLHAIAPVLALSMLITAIAVPAADSFGGGEESDPTFNLTPWQRQALIDLIEEVEASDMADVPKTVAVTELALLVTVLDEVGRVSGMKMAVNDTLLVIYSAVDIANTARHISHVLRESDNAQVSALGTAIGKLGALLVTEELSSIRDGFISPEGKEKLASFTSALAEAMSNPTFESMPDGDPLCEAISELSSALSAIDNDSSTLSEGEINNAISAANGSIGSALLTQSANESMEGRITRRLMEIFGLKASDITAGGDNDSQEEEGEGNDNGLLPDDDGNSEGGGIGTGEMTFGSNDMIYDPRTNTYEKYGDVIYHYHGIAMEKITDGAADPELEEIITRYFDNLYGTDNETE